MSLRFPAQDRHASALVLAAGCRLTDCQEEGGELGHKWHLGSLDAKLTRLETGGRDKAEPMGPATPAVRNIHCSDMIVTGTKRAAGS